MNAGVPPMIGTSAAAPAFLEHPKSMSLARPSAPITMFRDLTSPCTIPAPWRYASPVATSVAYPQTARSSSPRWSPHGPPASRLGLTRGRAGRSRREARRSERQLREAARPSSAAPPGALVRTP
ncbi:hypothetical protein ZWY2020_044553 [Hordeum vulgare]|nr:hypothetical protein ZWY2020_044553 [Hordeum vulgare]